MVYDEMFTQLDDAALTRFLEFVEKLCDDIGLQILLVTHDQRIQPEAVKHYYRIEDGKSIKIK
jgi:energy-coupling factor transporter ATP-binding protein EcfA2